ncbi:NrdH-redoxin [Candidatus Wolfebacteria bacterium]|nr:NrdH-redoxin [Candidatus Wolfebacteria bacterium]
MIKIYTTAVCPYCKMAKQYFEKNKINFEEANVESDAQAREEMFQKSHQMGVPVIDIDGEIVVGFDRSAIEKLLKARS